jgi:hypothetical protein
MLRAAVASLLNASHPGVHFPRTVVEVLTAADAAMASCDRETMIDLGESFDGDNNLGCPLDNRNGIDGGEAVGGDQQTLVGNSIQSIAYSQAIFYDGGYPADFTAKVFSSEDPSLVIGEVAFPYDPDNPPSFPVVGGGLCVQKITVHGDVALVFHAVADASDLGRGVFPDITVFSASIGTAVSSRAIETDCEVPMGPGFKFVPLFIGEVVVVIRMETGWR